MTVMKCCLTYSLLSVSVPQDFSYLPEKSIIRAIIDYLSEAGKKGLYLSLTLCFTIM